MKQTIISARILPDKTVVEMLPDGTERPFPKRPMRPMSEEEISAAAAADPDARAMTADELRIGAASATREDAASRPWFDPRGVRLSLSYPARHVA